MFVKPRQPGELPGCSGAWVVSGLAHGKGFIHNNIVKEWFHREGAKIEQIEGEEEKRTRSRAII